MTRVLFVDDEPKVLRGLQRTLAGSGCDWDTEVATSGREALTLLAQQPFDVVISDMRMPEMDGVTLLNEVMRLYPDVVRVVLSGHSERALILRSVGTTHQYLSKPCDATQVVDVVTRAMALRRVLGDPNLRTLVSQLSRIPSMPQVYRELMAEVERENHSLKALGQIVARDVGMTAKILQIVNSAFFGLPRHVPDPAQAVCMLGLEVLRALILTVQIFTELPLENLGELGLQNLWHHSTAAGAIAKRVASAEGCEHEMCDHALTAGLLHDTGKLILAVNRTDEYREAVRRASSGNVTRLAAEREVFGTTHAEVGAYLLGLWGLPDPVVEALAFHHRPADCMARAFAPVTAVHVANALEQTRQGPRPEGAPELVDGKYLARLGVAEHWPAWQAQCLTGASP